MKFTMLSLSKILLGITLSIPFCLFGTTHSLHDRTLYKTYFHDSIRYVIDLGTLTNLYEKLEQQEEWLARHVLTGKDFSRLKVCDDLSLFQYDDLYRSYTSSYRDLSVLKDLSTIFYAAHNLKEQNIDALKKVKLKVTGSGYYDGTSRADIIRAQVEARVKVERTKMKRYIKAFKSKATSLPLFYQIIDRVYGGNIDAYVDDLFDHSIFGHYDNLYLYKNFSLSSLRFRLDPLVVFSKYGAQYMNEDAKITHPTQTTATDNSNGERKLFKAYFTDSIRTKIDLITICHICFKKKADVRYENQTIIEEERYWGQFKPQTWWPMTFYDYDFEKFYRTNDGKYLYLLDDMFYRLHLGYNEIEDKTRMKRFIKDFRLKAQKLPTFYECIDKDFHDNVDAYVDYLFDESYFVHAKRFNQLKKWPKTKRLSHDPLVKYTLSVMQYLYCD